MNAGPFRTVSVIRGVRIGALGVWTGALLMTGAAAAVAFPTMRDLDPLLPAYGAYPQDHWSIAAGHIMRRVFGISDWTQLFCAGAVALTLGIEIALAGWKKLGMAWRVRGAVMLAAIACAAYSALVLAVRMNGQLDVYWEAARTGDIETAQSVKAAFDQGHVLARQLMTATFALVAAALVTSAIGSPCDAGACAPREDA